MKELEDYTGLTPYLRKKVEEYNEEWKIGFEEGLAEGFQRAFVIIVKASYPSLAELAQRKIPQITKPDKLELLLQQIIRVPDERIAHWLISTLVTE